MSQENEHLDLKSLKKELKQMSRHGYTLEINGCEATPGEIAKAHALAEGCSYMRDYIRDENGCLIRVSFQKIDDPKPMQ